MTRALLVLAGCLASVCAWAGCDKPAETAAQAPVQMPNDVASALDDGAPDPNAGAVGTAWRSYQDSIYDALSHSPDARDWALATVVGEIKLDIEEPARLMRNDLLERATRAAPDDTLVQWIALGKPGTHDGALAALHALEPDNAAVWVEDLIASTKRKDEVGIDRALAKMSAAHGFNNHFGDLLEAVADAYLRYPVSDDSFALISKADKTRGKEALAFTDAMTATAATALPAFQHLVNACRIDPVSGKNSARAADCAAIGRLMATQGDTLLANRLGYAVLRVSHAYTNQDLDVARKDDWIYSRYMELVKTELESAEQTIAYQKDWIETNNEMAAMRRLVLRSGVSETPPEDWADDNSEFRTDRVRSDAEWFGKNSAR